MRAGEFQEVKRHGQSRAGRLMVVSLISAPELPAAAPSRFGFISTRRLGGAVIRNRCRRRLREAVRLNLASIRPGYWIVIIARQGCVHAPLRQIEKEWLYLARKLGILLASGSREE